jgi:methionyl-tRNA synthetase
MTEVGFGNDGDFSDKALILKVNNNLANELGNLCQRVLSMVFKNCNKATPETVGELTDEDHALLDSAKGLHCRASAAISKQAIQAYGNELIQMVWDANKYIDIQAPWTLSKADPERMATILYVLMEVLRHVAILYQPIIPASAAKILDQLNVPASERTFEYLSEDAYKVKPGTPLSKPKGVFPRIKFLDEG